METTEKAIETTGDTSAETSDEASYEPSSESTSETEESETEGSSPESDTEPSSDQAVSKRILVVETTDIHGYIMDISSGNEDKYQYRLARIAKLINDEKESGKYDDVLLLDGGDIYQGAPVSLMTGGAVMRAAMDKMNYDAVALGNHEFDWDVEDLATDHEGTIAPYVLGDYFGDSKTPVLASDLFRADSKEKVDFTRDYTIVEKAGLRIAVIGYIPDYRLTIMASKIAPYVIEEDIRKLETLIENVKENEKPDVTILLAHEDAKKVTKALSKGIVDLVCGGHTHLIEKGTSSNGIPYIEGYRYGDGYASAVLTIDGSGNVTVEDTAYTSVTEDKTLLYDNEKNEGNFDPEILEISKAGWSVIADKMSEVLGYTDVPILKRKNSQYLPCSAGNWVTGIMLKTTAEYETVMAFYNTDGIRTSFEMPDGETTRNITVGDIYSMLPFGNLWLVYELNGPEIKRHLVNILKEANFGDQASGLTFTYTATGTDEDNRYDREYTILSVTLDDGTEIDLEDTETFYRVVTSEYNSTMPNSVFEDKTPVFPAYNAPIDNETIIGYLRNELADGDGYIPVDESGRGVRIEAEP